MLGIFIFIAIATYIILWWIKYKNKETFGFQLSLIGGILCICEASTSWGVGFGFYGMWMFLPEFLIVGALAISGAILGKKGNKTGLVLCMIAGISGIISTVIIGGIICPYVWEFFLYAFSPLIGGLFVGGTLFIMIGGIITSVILLNNHIIGLRSRSKDI